jgi:recombination protein RecT
MSDKQWAIAIADAEQKFSEIAASTGYMVTYQREASFALQAIQNSTWLQGCSAESISNAILNVASVGLSLSPALKLAYLVPRKGKACLDISYIGLVKIATDSGSVLAAKAEVVRSNDNFEYIDGFTQPSHKFNPFAKESDRGEFLGVYVVAKLGNGVTLVDAMSAEVVGKIRAKSEAKTGPWGEWFDEMAKKSVIKRASKMWPRTERLATAVEHLDHVDGTDGITIDDARAALSAADERKTRLVGLAQKAATTDELAAVWQQGTEECSKSKDRETYAALKAAVSARKTELEAPAQEAA